MNIPMLSDQSKSISKSHRCLVEDPNDENYGVSMRARYIIDSKGILRHMSVSDLPVGRDAGEYLRLVQAFQHTDEYGEVYPASWKPGQPTLEADDESKKTEKYWEETHSKFGDSQTNVSTNL